MKGIHDLSNEVIQAVIIRWFLIVQAICFVGAGASHVRDIWQGGFLPYNSAPPSMNLFWTSLAGLDLLAAWLLVRRPTIGLLLAIVIMVADVGVNSYAKYGLGLLAGSYGDVALQLQTLFLGFVIGSAPFVLWSAQSENGR